MAGAPQTGRDAVWEPPCWPMPPAVFALLVDARNDDAVAFYRRFGFAPLSSQPRTLFLPMATAEKLLTLPREA